MRILEILILSQCHVQYCIRLVLITYEKHVRHRKVICIIQFHKVQNHLVVLCYSFAKKVLYLKIILSLCFDSVNWSEWKMDEKGIFWNEKCLWSNIYLRRINNLITSLSISYISFTKQCVTVLMIPICIWNTFRTWNLIRFLIIEAKQKRLWLFMVTYHSNATWTNLAERNCIVTLPNSYSKNFKLIQAS